MSLLIDVHRPRLKPDPRAVLGVRPPEGWDCGACERVRRAWRARNRA